MSGPITIIGGKSRVAKSIIALFPDHLCYAEPFSGGAQVLFRKPPSRVEVLNDLDGELVNFFRVCQAHPDELIRCLAWHMPSRKWFDLLKQSAPHGLTDIQRAVRFFYISRLSFGGRVLNPTFGYGVTERPRFRFSRLPSILKAAHERLRDVQIECLPYQELLQRYDTKDTLFFCDPPYWKRPYYNYNFNESQFLELAEALTKLKGKFLLTINDVAEVRRIFGSFSMMRIEPPYSCHTGETRARGRELLIHNIPAHAMGYWSRRKAARILSPK